MQHITPLATRALLLVVVLAALAGSARANQEFVVAPGGVIADAIAAAGPGDTITLQPGTYTEALTTVRGGTASAPITIRAAQGRGSVIVTRAGQVLRVSHPFIVIDGLILDGQYGAADTVRLATEAHGFVLRRSEVRRSGRDCVDMAAPTDVLLEHSSINHCLWWDGGRRDAHAVVAGAARRLTLRHLDIHTFSGDGLQLDPGRALPGWDEVTIEHTSFRLAPLPAAQNGFPKGAVPGENAIDTKTHPTAPRARMTITDTTAQGFGPGLISNMAAFNLKERVDVSLDRVTVSLSEIAFRLRGPGANGGAWVSLRNVVMHNVVTGIRYEDDIEQLEVTHVTFGRHVSVPLRAASSGWGGVRVQNTLFFDTPLPKEAPGAGGNLTAGAAWFVAAASDDYRLQAGSPAIDTALGELGVTTDRLGTARPQGQGPDVGAYERASADVPPPPVTTRPSPPSQFTATAVLKGTSVSVTLTWQDNAVNETGFDLQRSVNGGSFTTLAALPADTTGFVDTTTARATTYRYRVRATSPYGRSSFAKGTVVTP